MDDATPVFPIAMEGNRMQETHNFADPAAGRRRRAPLAPMHDAAGPTRYASWSVEELRALAVQLQLPDAAAKTRRELLDLLGPTR